MAAGKVHTVGIIMNGVTGRMGANQHLLRSIVPIRREGGVRIGPDETIVPEPILVGRNPIKLQKLAASSGIERWSADLDAVLSDPFYSVYFDAQLTRLRAPAVLRAVAAGKHVYCEKPVAVSTEEALSLYRAARSAGLKHGVVQDKLWLPGIAKLRDLIAEGFFGRILSVRGEFGYWVFEGDPVPPQRPSWNYRKEEGGGIIVDMLCHWRYLLDNVFGNIRSLSCIGATHIPVRVDEEGKRYDCTADDSVYCHFLLDDDIVVSMNSSWDVRVRRDDLLTLQVDGTKGSAVAGLRGCRIQPYAATPRPIWNPDIPSPIDFYADWMEVPDQRFHDNAFKLQWELFLRHVVLDEPFPWDLLEGAKGVQLAELGIDSWRERRWLDVPPLVKNGPH